MASEKGSAAGLAMLLRFEMATFHAAAPRHDCFSLEPGKTKNLVAIDRAPIYGINASLSLTPGAVETEVIVVLAVLAKRNAHFPSSTSTRPAKCAAISPSPQPRLELSRNLF
jgi:hypothetical protein